MVVHDLLYGRFQIPDVFDRLVMVPEVRRLSQVRLLNCLTPTLSGLGEARRFSHTLGVLHLWSQLPVDGWAKTETDALGAAILLHDIGTPAFGHLFEYQLKELAGWSHEEAIHSILWGILAPEDRAHQIFAGRTAQFRKELGRTGIDVDLVDQIVSGKHPLSKALFGSIDLDNLDNVSRMAALLGHPGTGAVALGLAQQLRFRPDGRLSLEERTAKALIGQWQALRRGAYEIIVFDQPTVAAQAVLSDVIRSAIQRNELTVDDWYLWDEELLRRLGSRAESKRDIQLEYLGILPQCLFAIQIDGSVKDLGFGSVTGLREAVLKSMHERSGLKSARAYVFVDSGAFSKRLTFVEASGREWHAGEDSRSVVVYGFSRERRILSRKVRRQTAEAVCSALNVQSTRVLRMHVDQLVTDAEPTLNF